LVKEEKWGFRISQKDSSGGDNQQKREQGHIDRKEKKGNRKRGIGARKDGWSRKLRPKGEGSRKLSNGASEHVLEGQHLKKS